MIQISNCPDTGLKRFVEHKDFQKLESVKQVILRCHFKYLKADNTEPKNQTLKPYCDLVASDSYCNPDGSLWSAEESALYNKYLADKSAYDYQLEIYNTKLDEFNDLFAVYEVAYENWSQLPAEERGQQPLAPVAPIAPTEPAAPEQTPITEFDFFMYLTTQPIKMGEMENNYIAMRDAEGKLNK
jgi:hypothetical protein